MLRLALSVVTGYVKGYLRDSATSNFAIFLNGQSEICSIIGNTEILVLISFLAEAALNISNA